MQLPVECTEDVLHVMSTGAANRAVAETRMNERSSRSHSVLTVMVNGASKLDHNRFHGCLHLIDLAGAQSAESPKESQLSKQGDFERPAARQ